MITIKTDDDIKDFIFYCGLNNITHHSLKHIYKMPGYRGYFNLGEFNSNLFIEIIVSTIFNIQWEWNHPKSLFVKILNSFGCRDTFFLNNNNSYITYIRHSHDFDVCKEYLLIEKFSNILSEQNKNYMKRRYNLK